MTDYATNQSNGKNKTESALFAWAVLAHPERLPQIIDVRKKEIMSNSLAFFEYLHLKNKPCFVELALKKVVDPK